MGFEGWRRWALVPSAACVVGLSAPASAAEKTFSFDIPAKPLKTALIDLAIESGVSISTQAASACAPNGHAVKGRLTLKAGLETLLAGTGCGFRMIDAHAVEIFRLPRDQPAPAKPSPKLQTEEASGLSELVIVATRRLTPADRLAYAVSALDSATVSAQGLRDAGDLAMAVPSMTVTNLGAGRDKIMLRGMSDGPLTGRAQSMVGLYLDDTRLTYNAPDPDLLLIDVAQVEVLRGPQGALYGAGSLGGVLHLVTEKPNPTGFEAWISAAAGATKGGAPSGGASGMINLPLFQGRGAARLVAYRDVQGGYIDDAGLGLKNINRTVRMGARLALRLDLNDSWTLSTGATLQAINTDDTQYGQATEARYTRRNQVREPHDNDFSEAHIGLSGDLDGVEARGTLSAVRHDITSRYDATSAPPISLAPGPAAYDDASQIQSVLAEGSLASPATARVQWLAGVFLAHTQQDADFTLTRLADAPRRAFAENRRDTLSEAALFGEVTLPIRPSLSLTLGGRLFGSKTEVSSLIQTQTDAPIAYHGRLSQSGFAPKIVLSYSLSPEVLIYLQAAEGYRAGGFNTTGAPGQIFSTAGSAEPRRIYDRDELWSIEAGGKLSFLDDKAKLRIAVFETLWNNIQSDQLLASGLPFTANIGDGRNIGLELESAYRTGRLRLAANVLINRPELENPNAAFPARRDMSLAGVPSRQGGVTAHYDWPLTSGLNLEFDGRYAYVGHSRLTFDATTAPAMGSYATGRLALGLATPRWRLTAAVDNPMDSHGDTFAYGNPFSLRTIRQVTPPRPRTASVTFRVAY